jgi:hypothetical protein
MITGTGVHDRTDQPFKITAIRSLKHSKSRRRARSAPVQQVVDPENVDPDTGEISSS